MRKNNIILLILLMIATLSTVSALKTFDKDVPKYGEIKIKDFLIFNRASYVLLDYGCSVIDCYAEGNYTLYKKTSLFDNLFYKDLRGNKRDYQETTFYYWGNKTITEIVPLYYDSCTTKQEQNGTATSCITLSNGTTTTTKTISDWLPYTKKTELEEQSGKWRIEFKRPINEPGDFILNSNGYDLDNWAWYNNTWTYKQLITINFSGSVNLTQHWLNFTYVGQTGKFQSDFSDLRFINYAENKEMVWKYTQKNSTEIRVQLFTEDSTQNISNGGIQFWAYYGVTSYVSPGWNTTFYYGDTFTNKTAHGWTTGLQGAGLYTISGNDLYLNANGSATSTIYMNLPPSVANWSTYTINANHTWAGCVANDGSYFYAGLGETGANPTQKMVGIFSNGRYSGYSNDNYGNGFANLLTNVTNVGVNICNNWITSEVVQTGNRNDSATTRQQTNYWERDGYVGSGFFTNTTTSYQMTNTPAMFIYTNSRWANDNTKLNFILLSKGNGTQNNYSVGAEQEAQVGPTIILYSPANNLNTSNNNQNFIAYISSKNNVANVSLIINNIYNETNTSGINATNYTFNKIFTDNLYTWLIESCAVTGVCTNSSSRSITIDRVAPTFTINAYTNPIITTTLPKNSTVNITTIDTNLNTCWYYTSDSATNTTVTCNSVFNISWATGGTKTIYFFANDSAGNINTISYSFLLNYLVQGMVYTSPILEGVNNTITFNITASSITNLTGWLTWNGTLTSSNNSNNGTYGTLTNTFVVPVVSSNQNITFNYTYNLDGVNYTTINYYQLINFLSPINISASCSDKALRFWVQNEANLTNVTATISYNIQYGTVYNNTYKLAYGSISNVSDFYLCINGSLGNYTLGYGELQYSTTNYVDRRYYLFTNLTLSNSSIVQHYLRVLPTADQTSFLLTFEDTDLNPYTNKYTALWRWYPDLNQYQIVEMGKTDSDGQTVAHVRTEDVDYRTALYETNGTLIAFDDPRRFVCTASPCSLTIRPQETETDQTSFFDVQVSLDYNETLKTFTLTYNDPNQYTSGMTLVVERLSGDNSLTICNTTSTGFTGVITCNASAYTGTFKATAWRYASPGIPIAQKIVNTANTFFRSGFGLFISAIIWLAVALTGLTGNPIIMVIGAVIGLIPALILGTINATIFTGVAVLGAIILHFIRRALS